MTIIFTIALLDCMGFEWIQNALLLAYKLGEGWIEFLVRVCPAVRVKWGMINSALVYMGILAVGMHLFFRWIFREMRGSDPTVRWRRRTTIGVAGLAFLMFVVGLSAVGAVRQVSWLVSGPVFKPYFLRPDAIRIECESHLNQIGQAMQLYRQEHNGANPPDFASLLAGNSINSYQFICPGAGQTAAVGDTLPSVLDDFATPNHVSYIYLFNPTKKVFAADDPVIIEPLSNHQDQGMHVLCGDGHVDWLGRDAAVQLLARYRLQPDCTATSRPVFTSPASQHP